MTALNAALKAVFDVPPATSDAAADGIAGAIEDEIDARIAASGGGGLDHGFFAASTSSGNYFTSGGSFVTANFENTVRDDSGAFSSSIYTVQETGWHHFVWSTLTGNVAWSAAAYWTAQLAVDDLVTEGNSWGPYIQTDAAVTKRVFAAGSVYLYLTAGQTVRVKCAHNQGGTIGLNGSYTYNYFCGGKVS